MVTNIIAIFQKQIKDTFKNKTILIQFIMFPILAVIMENGIKIEGMPDHFFANLYAVMYIGMAPLTSMAAVISEEKEKNTLRVLLMSNVKPVEYLLGIGGYIWLICMLGSCVFGICGEYSGKTWANYMFIMAVGTLVSILIGAAIGTWSKNQMMATSIVVPVMIVFSFLPMISMFNTNIKKISKITYSGQINLLIKKAEISIESMAVILLNMVIAMILFGYAYRKRGLG